MRTRTPLRSLFVAGLLSLALAGCEQQDAKHPETSSDQGTYAAEFPERVAAESKGIHDDEATVKADVATFKDFPSKLKDPPGDLTKDILDAADKAGSDGGYAEEMERQEAVRQFYEEEKDELNKKVGGAAQYAAKGCSGSEAYGAAVNGLKTGIDERLKARARAKNDAFLMIDRHRDELGQQNAAALEDEADKIAEASYIVHVRLPRQRARLEHDISEASSQKSKLEELIKDEKDLQASGKLKADGTKASEARVKRYEEALGKFDAAQKEAEENQKDLEQRIADLTKQYDDAFSAMKDGIKGGEAKDDSKKEDAPK
ncbi:MAG: hypothetical protein U0414_21570 [Polyangiaceae bacterium]